MEFQIVGWKISWNFTTKNELFKGHIRSIFKMVTSQKFQIRKSWVNFLTKSTVFMIGAFHIRKSNIGFFINRFETP